MKRNVIILYEKLSPTIKAAIEMAHPYGVEDKIFRYQDLSTGKNYDGLSFEHEDINYLIKFQLDEGYSILNYDEDEEDDDGMIELDEINDER